MMCRRVLMLTIAAAQGMIFTAIPTTLNREKSFRCSSICGPILTQSSDGLSGAGSH